MLELFSGIGGYHCALKELSNLRPDLDFKVEAAIDVNENANCVYRHNFPEVHVISKAFETISDDVLQNLNTDMIVMSPPCQPFTRLGLKKDTGDSRSRGLNHVIKCLLNGVLKPTWILLENVKGFEDSEAFREFSSALDSLGYAISVEFLHPFHFGVPNARLRCYVLASKVLSSIRPISRVKNLLSLESCRLSPYVRPAESVPEEFFISHSTTLKYLAVMDVVSRNSNHCMCFTKSYGRYYEGTGSLVFEPNCEVDHSDDQKSSVELKALISGGEGKLRHFSDEEVMRLHSFPQWFSFPDNISTKQRYKMLGNGLNVLVVQELLTHLIGS